MKNVIIYTNIPSPYRVALFRHMRKENTDIRFKVLYQTKSESDRSWSVDQKEIKEDFILGVRRICVCRGKRTKYISFPKRIRSTIRSLSPDAVVISEYNPGSILLAVWCLAHKVPYVSWTDGTIYFERNISLLQKAARKFMIRNADAYIASSTQSVKNQIHYGAMPERIFLSPLTVDTDKIRYEKKEFHAEKFLYVGRLVEIKGVDLLIEAFARVEDRQCELWIVGDGKEKKRLRDLCTDRGIENRVFFCGFREGKELWEYYRKCDILVLPSRQEVYGLVILEAMCNSMPVICSKYADGHYDLLEDGENGVCVNPYDTEEFAGVICSFCGDSGRVEKMGRKSFEKSKLFSIKESAEVFEEAVRTLLRK